MYSRVGKVIGQHTLRCYQNLVYAGLAVTDHFSYPTVRLHLNGHDVLYVLIMYNTINSGATYIIDCILQPSDN